MAFLKTDIGKIYKQLGKTEEDIYRDINIIKNWLKTQHHLPEVPSDIMIQYFLINNKCSIERTKQTLDMYYSIRTLMPEVFQNSSPISPDFQGLWDVFHFSPLPNLTPKLQRIIMGKFVDIDASHFNAEKGLSYLNSLNEIRIQEDLSLGDVVILDYKHISMLILPKFTPRCIRKFNFILEEVWGTSIAEFHIINAPTFTNNLISLFKKYLHKELSEKLFVHKSLEDLYKYVPQALLPKEYGGDEKSLDELCALWRKKWLQYHDRFETLERLRVDEQLRPAPYKNSDIFGYYGNYMQVDVN